MTRLRARAPKGKRAYGKVPRNRGKNTTLIAAITLEGAMGESMTVEGATDAKAFEAYVRAETSRLSNTLVSGSGSERGTRAGQNSKWLSTLAIAYLPVKVASRFSRNADTPSLWSSVYPQKVCPAASVSRAVVRSLSKLA